jgi:hypothetical protein
MHVRSSSVTGKVGSSLKTKLTPVNLDKVNYNSRQAVNDRQRTLSPQNTTSLAKMTLSP